MLAGKSSRTVMIRVSPGCRWRFRRAGRQATHVFHQYVIRLAERDALRETLRLPGSAAEFIIRSRCINSRPTAAVSPAVRSGLGVTERAAPQILSLPIYPQLSDEAVDRVIAEIRSFFG